VPRKTLPLIVSHGIAIAVGFAAGIYLLPILIAPASPSESDVQAVAGQSRYTGEFRRDLEDSDPLHWGDGTVFVSADTIALEGRIAPGPDYRLYLSPEFVETEADFESLKAGMTRIGDVKTFENFLVSVPADVNIDDYNSVIVWCESFGEFITAARYR
jgi:hypothetical protein